MPAGLASGIWFYDRVDEHYKKKLAQKVMDGIEKNSEAWNNLIENDYHYADLREKLESGELGAKDARGEAYIRSQSLGSYNRYMNENYSKVPREQSDLWALNHSLFQHIRKLAESGVPKTAGFEYTPDFSPELSGKQIRDLIDLRHEYFSALQIIPLMVNAPDQLVELKKDPATKNLVDGVAKDPYAQFLFDLHKSGKLTDKQLVFRLQEDVFWQTRFLEWEVLGVKKVKKVGGKYSQEPLTVQDIRSESVAEMRAESTQN